MYEEKGTTGYIRKYKKQYFMISLILLGIIVVSVAIILAFKGNLKNLYAVIPVLMALPLAKCLVNWYIVAAFHPIKEEEADRIAKELEGRPNNIILYDTALSAYEAVSYSGCTVIDQGNVYLLWSGSYSKQYKDYHQKEYVQQMIEKTGYSYKAYTVKTVEELIAVVKASEISSEDLSGVCERLKERILGVCV